MLLRSSSSTLTKIWRKMSYHTQMIAVTQMTVTDNKKENLSTVEYLLRTAASRGAKMVFLPEACDFIGESKKDTLDMAESVDGPTVAIYCQLARSLEIWVSVGGMHIKEEGEKKTSNTHIIINNLGNIVSKYNKTHLFHVKIPDQNIDLQESKYVNEGHAIFSPVSTPCGLVASGICYDMRFPEFSLLQRQAGAQILTFPSAFTVPTGLAHWHTLLRARAIETQCYVVAAAQVGQHNTKRSSYGHALVVDPWGAVICEVSDGLGVAFAEIDLQYLEKIRREMPVLNHRRRDLYALHNLRSSSEPRLMELIEFPPDFASYPFGTISLRGDFILLRSVISHVFVNRMPFAPGHSLVTPQKPIERFIQLNDGEVGDLAQMVVATMQILREEHKTKNIQFAIQDGKWAGQTVQHVHAHVIPIVDKGSVLLESHEKKDKKEWRQDEDMAREALTLRQHSKSIQMKLGLSSFDMPRPLKFEACTNEELKIDDVSIPTDKIFLYTGKCYAFLPGNPVLPGHACICSRSETSSLADLSPAEVTDLFLAFKSVQETMESYFNTSSTTIFISHARKERVCAHILPRKENDLESNDDLYVLLLNLKIVPPSHSNELFNHLREKFNPQ